MRGSHRVADQARALPGDAVEVRREARVILVRIPLEAIGRPERVLVSAATRFGDVPLSSQPWRILELTAAEAA